MQKKKHLTKFNPHSEWEKVFASHIADKMLESKIYKVISKINSKEN